MSALTKILLVILLLVFVALGVEVFLYFQVQSRSSGQTTQNSTPTPIPSPYSTTTVDITGKVALVGYLNLFDITKEQVAEWAKASGPVEVPTYSGPLPTPPPEIATLSGQISPIQRPKTIKVTAGYFRSGQAATGVVISQGGKEITLTFNQGARLWIKKENKLQLVSLPISNLLASGTLVQTVNINDLVLIPNINETLKGTNSLFLVVFK